MPEIAIPVNKIDGLLTPEFEGWLDGIDKRWNKRSPLNGDLSFAFYPLRNNRMLGPRTTTLVAVSSSRSMTSS